MTEVGTALLAFFGAALGSGLAFWAARAATKLDATQGRREEWGRRFTLSVDAVTSPHDRTADIGRALLEALMTSELAAPDDRQAAVAVLAADANFVAGVGDLRATLSVGSVDPDVAVEDDGIDEEGDRA